MAFNISDEYHVHAYMAVCFACDRCGADLDLTSTHEPASDEWCEEAATQARQAGWYVPPADAEGGIDAWTCYCPRCAPGDAARIGAPAT